MSDQPDRQPVAGTPAQDDAVASLLKLAGPREPVPAERMRRLKVAAHADWRRHTATRRRRLAVGWAGGGLAAAAALAIALRMPVGSDPTGGQGATVVALSGTAELASGAGPEPLALRVGDRVPMDRETLASGVGTATLRLPGGASVRLSTGTSLRMAAADALVLNAGAIYVDTAGASLEIRTRIGLVRDVGTKFEVRLGPSSLRVRVRDGAVQVRREQAVHDARPGDELTLDSAGAVTWHTVPLDGPAWAWASDRGAPFELEGRSLHEFLDWIAGENGWQLQFANAAVEDQARTTTLHGSIQGLTPEQALAAVLPTSGVEHQLDGDILSIRLGVGVKN
jgi:ferric-dicitrate binding protein FerR (iron transport regulator)